MGYVKSMDVAVQVAASDCVNKAVDMGWLKERPGDKQNKGTSEKRTLKRFSCLIIWPTLSAAQQTEQTQRPQDIDEVISISSDILNKRLAANSQVIGGNQSMADSAGKCPGQIVPSTQTKLNKFIEVHCHQLEMPVHYLFLVII